VFLYVIFYFNFPPMDDVTTANVFEYEDERRHAGVAHFHFFPCHLHFLQLPTSRPVALEIDGGFAPTRGTFPFQSGRDQLDQRNETETIMFIVNR